MKAFGCEMEVLGDIEHDTSLLTVQLNFEITPIKHLDRRTGQPIDIADCLDMIGQQNK